jgi:hypothetical protein
MTFQKGVAGLGVARLGMAQHRPRRRLHSHAVRRMGFAHRVPNCKGADFSRLPAAEQVAYARQGVP